MSNPTMTVCFSQSSVLIAAAAAVAVHCLSFTCGTLIATSIVLLNEFVYPAQFTKMMGKMLQPLSSKLITLSLDKTTKQC